MTTKLFPPSLNQGSKGPAVNMLGLLMKATGFEDPNRPIVFDGDYTPGGAIAAAVESFQAHFDFDDDDIDGNFGPKTRTKFRTIYRIDVDDLTLEMFQGETISVGSDSK